MNIAYFTNPHAIHCFKWINYFSKHNNVIIFCEKSLSGVTSPFSHPQNLTIYPILPDTYPLRNFLFRFSTTRKIKTLLKKHGTELTHSMYVVSYAFWAHHAKAPNHIITTRGSDILVEYKKLLEPAITSREKRMKEYFKKLFRVTFEKARFITSTSNKQKMVVESIIPSSGKQCVIRTGVDVDYFLSISNRIRIDVKKEQLIIFSPRSMKPLYNIDIIIDAVFKFNEQNTNRQALLHIIDDYPETNYSEYIRKKIRSQKSNYCVILDKQNQEQMIALYKNSDIVVMIPSSDGTPVSGVEAMLSKIPLILGNLEYDADLFNENTVWKINNFSSADLCDKIAEVIHSADKQLKLNAAYNTALSNADMRRELKKVEALYHSAINVAIN